MMASLMLGCRFSQAGIVLKTTMPSINFATLCDFHLTTTRTAIGFWICKRRKKSARRNHLRRNTTGPSRLLKQTETISPSRHFLKFVVPSLRHERQAKRKRGSATPAQLCWRHWRQQEWWLLL